MLWKTDLEIQVRSGQKFRKEEVKTRIKMLHEESIKRSKLSFCKVVNSKMKMKSR